MRDLSLLTALHGILDLKDRALASRVSGDVNACSFPMDSWLCRGRKDITSTSSHGDCSCSPRRSGRKQFLGYDRSPTFPHTPLGSALPFLQH